MSVSTTSGPVVVGVYPGQPVAVVQEGAALAALIDRPLLCAYVTPDSYLTEWERADLRREASLHPSGVTPEDERLAIDLAAAITSSLAASPTSAADLHGGWVLRMLAGDPSKALARVAAEVDAALIVVGTHQAGFGHAVEEWLSGSVAVQLTRAQQRSVLVVPIGHDSRRTPTLG